MHTFGLPGFLHLDPKVDDIHADTGGFKLTRYVILTSLIALAIVVPLFFISEHLEEVFFENIQKDQMAFFGEVQAESLRAHEVATQKDILKMHEVSHVNLAHVVANTVWDRLLAPFVARAQSIPIEQCSPAGSVGPPMSDTAATTTTRAEQDCFAKVGQTIRTLPQFTELDSTIRAAMRKSTVFKIKVFDLRGVTVYSSEHQQIGENKVNNQGWMTAAGGHAASELTHRERFSAFEGVVEDRDLISSYIPILTENNKVAGVFEIYSDASPYLKTMQDALTQMAQRADENRTRAEWVAKQNQARISSHNESAQIIVLGLLALFYAALLLIVRNGQQIINRQAHEQAQAGDRERQWHREKMTALATMAANVSHEVGNPLATISALAQNIEAEKALHACQTCQPKMILDQTDRIVTMTRQIVNFASVRSEVLEPVDVNQMVKSVCDFLGFDHRFRGVHIETKLGGNLPARVVIPDNLNESLMYLVQDALESNLRTQPSNPKILVETEMRDENVLIRIVFNPNATNENGESGNKRPDSRFEIARRRLTEMGGLLAWTNAMTEITLVPFSGQTI